MSKGFEILPGLFLGSKDAVNNGEFMCTRKVCEHYPDCGIAGLDTFKRIAVSDNENTNLEQYFDDTYAFIEAGLQSGSVLVHCLAGLSRSPTVVAAYLIRKLNWSARQALDFIELKRGEIYPNLGFQRQLETYAQRVTRVQQ